MTQAVLECVVCVLQHDMSSNLMVLKGWPCVSGLETTICTFLWFTQPNLGKALCDLCPYQATRPASTISGGSNQHAEVELVCALLLYVVCSRIATFSPNPDIVVSFSLLQTAHAHEPHPTEGSSLSHGAHAV